MVCHLGEGEEVEVAEEAHRHRVSASPWGSHASNELDVHQVSECAGRDAVVPAFVVHPLSKNLDGWLSEVFLSLRHVHIVHEDYILLQRGRTIHTFASLLRFRIDQILQHACAKRLDFSYFFKMCKNVSSYCECCTTLHETENTPRVEMCYFFKQLSPYNNLLVLYPP